MGFQFHETKLSEQKLSGLMDIGFDNFMKFDLGCVPR
jgi:hypothetical protein